MLANVLTRKVTGERSRVRGADTVVDRTGEGRLVSHKSAVTIQVTPTGVKTSRATAASPFNSVQLSLENAIL